MFRSIALLFLAFLVGCSSKPELMTEPVSITGKVLLADGSPMKAGSITLQPMETGHPMTYKLEKDGTFKGEIVPGKFMYFVPESAGAAVLKGVDPKFQTPDVNRFTTVKAGEPIEIKLQ